jgi:hypothetical protein
MENENEVVNEEVTTPEEVIEAPVQAGDKTPPNELLNSLQTERERRRVAEDKQKLLEEEIEALKNNPKATDEDVFSDEGKLLKKEISTVKQELSGIKEEAERKKIFETYPKLLEKEAEFEDYRKQNKGMSLNTAAKAFLAENNMLSAGRKGLENTTGGDKGPSIQGMTANQVKDLRQSNYKEYVRLLSEDKIKIV